MPLSGAIAGRPATRTGGHRACARRVAGSANPASSAGHAPTRTEANYKLTFNLDHSVGADHGNVSPADFEEQSAGSFGTVH